MARCVGGKNAIGCSVARNGACGVCLVMAWHTDFNFLWQDKYCFLHTTTVIRMEEEKEKKRERKVFPATHKLSLPFILSPTLPRPPPPLSLCLTLPLAALTARCTHSPRPSCLPSPIGLPTTCHIPPPMPALVPCLSLPFCLFPFPFRLAAAFSGILTFLQLPSFALRRE